MCDQATGDSAYLSDANDFYILHLYQETSGPTSLAVDWSEYFWSANILLATLTDGSTFHQRAQYFMRQWVCGYGQVRGPAECINVNHSHDVNRSIPSNVTMCSSSWTSCNAAEDCAECACFGAGKGVTVMG